jgi:CheY-like chemotaxis protein
VKKILLADDSIFMRKLIKTYLFMNGAKYFLVKPFKEEQLVNTINIVLGK